MRLLLTFCFIVSSWILFSTSVRAQNEPLDEARREAWQAFVVQVPIPKPGCFEAEFPTPEWREVACTAPPDYPQPPRVGPRTLVVGNGTDVAAQAPTGHIATATGSFDSVTNVTSESGPIGNTGPSIANAYTLQLNTETFTTTACNSSPNAQCRGWEQFVFENYGSGARAYIPYWLLNYNKACPPNVGWNQFSFSGSTDIYCWKNNQAGAVTVPKQPIANLVHLSLTGTATSTGDQVGLSTGTTVYAVAGDNAVNAWTGWRFAEFNIFGDGGNNAGGGMASFNSGAVIVPRTKISYGGKNAPNCVSMGFTAETNNLSFGPNAPPLSPPGPAVFFTESSVGGAASPCLAATTVGDTHMTTFGGLLYDFQATGDFILAQTDQDFLVEARQVSGKPNWPDASINKAIATQMGKTRVTICLEPEPRLVVNDEGLYLKDGEARSVSDDVDVSRAGNVYFIAGKSGDSVRAQLNPNYIDVSVGLGQWPAPVRGLLANVDNDIHHIATRSGDVLKTPISFDDLYRRYGDSWRVGPKETLLSPCSEAQETANPEKPFYADALPPETYQGARAICREAGVEIDALLEACMLDVAVEGEGAAAIYVHTPPPADVLRPR